MVWDAPCLIMVHGPDKADSAVNAALAAQNIQLQAHAMGLGSCILGLLEAGLDHAENDLKRAGVYIPADHKIHMILSLGIPPAGLTYRKIPPRRAVRVQFIGD
jgi:nitroreductase